MAADPAVLTIPAEVREPLDAACFVFPEEARAVRIDMRGVRWIAPVGVVALLAQCLRSRDLETDVRVLLPRSREVRSYLRAIGFYQALRDQGVPVDEGAFDLDPQYAARPRLPLTMVTTELEVEWAQNALGDALRESLGPSNLQPALDIVVSELASNAREHGSPCFMVAQTHGGERSGAPGVHIAIADFGPGFMRTLAAYAPASEADAIERAFEEGVTGTGKMRGSGLAEAQRYIDGYPGARLAIASRSGFVARANRSFQRSEGPDCGGVFVSVHFPYRDTPSLL